MTSRRGGTDRRGSRAGRRSADRRGGAVRAPPVLKSTISRRLSRPSGLPITRSVLPLSSIVPSGRHLTAASSIGCERRRAAGSPAGTWSSARRRSRAARPARRRSARRRSRRVRDASSASDAIASSTSNSGRRLAAPVHAELDRLVGDEPGGVRGVQANSSGARWWPSHPCTFDEEALADPQLLAAEPLGELGDGGRRLPDQRFHLVGGNTTGSVERRSWASIRSWLGVKIISSATRPTLPSNPRAPLRHDDPMAVNPSASISPWPHARCRPPPGARSGRAQLPLPTSYRRRAALAAPSRGGRGGRGAGPRPSLAGRGHRHDRGGRRHQPPPVTGRRPAAHRAVAGHRLRRPAVAPGRLMGQRGSTPGARRSSLPAPATSPSARPRRRTLRVPASPPAARRRWGPGTQSPSCPRSRCPAAEAENPAFFSAVEYAPLRGAESAGGARLGVRGGLAKPRCARPAGARPRRTSSRARGSCPTTSAAPPPDRDRRWCPVRELPGRPAARLHRRHAGVDQHWP